MKRPSSFSLIGISLGALAAIAIAALVVWNQLGSAGAPAEQSNKVGFKPVIDIGGPFTLVDHTGENVSARDFHGKYMLIFFGYTYCPDICPTGLADISTALKSLGDKAEKIQPVFVTIDPERDTPEQLAKYVTHFYPTMKGLTGTEEQIDAISKAYRVFRRKVSDGSSSEYLMDHSTFIYLMNPKGKLAMMFRHGTEADVMADAIAEELNEKS